MNVLLYKFKITRSYCHFSFKTTNVPHAMKYLDFTITDLPLVLSNKPVH